MPTNTSGLVFTGAGRAEASFGNGLRGVSAGGAGIFRYEVQDGGFDGHTKLGPGIAAEAASRFDPSGHIQPGDRWNFQLWYRDPNGPCGAEFNTSNAVTALFGS